MLDSTNLSRHLVLAAPILSLGLPTLVILNMADDLAQPRRRADPAELSEQLGTPVALVSASKGQGLDKVFQFLDGATAAHAQAARVELPVIQDIPTVPGLGGESGQSTPNIMRPRRRCGRGGWTRFFCIPSWDRWCSWPWCIGVFQTIFFGADPLMNAVDTFRSTASGKWIGALIHIECDAFACSWTASGAAWGRWSCSCRRFCCCSCSSEFWKIRATWRARR